MAMTMLTAALGHVYGKGSFIINRYHPFVGSLFIVMVFLLVVLSASSAGCSTFLILAFAEDQAFALPSFLYKFIIAVWTLNIGSLSVLFLVSTTSCMQFADSPCEV